MRSSGENHLSDGMCPLPTAGSSDQPGSAGYPRADRPCSRTRECSCRYTLPLRACRPDLFSRHTPARAPRHCADHSISLGQELACRKPFISRLRWIWPDRISLALFDEEPRIIEMEGVRITDGFRNYFDILWGIGKE